MITINNYDSRLTLSNYKIEDTYMFYIHNSNIKNLHKIKESDFEPYIKTLNSIIEIKTIENNTPYLNRTRSVGVVVDKHESTGCNDIDYITVLFKTTSNDYVINKYVVNYDKTII